MSKEGERTYSFVAFPPPSGNMIVGDGQGSCKFTVSVPEAEMIKANEAYLALIGKAFLVTLTPVDVSKGGLSQGTGQNNHLAALVEDNADPLVE